MCAVAFDFRQRANIIIEQKTTMNTIQTILPSIVFICHIECLLLTMIVDLFTITANFEYQH
jgi:hypothetical protein